MTSDNNQASASLRAIGDAKARLAAAADCPPERHLAFAAVIGALVAGPIVPLPWRFVVLAACFVSIALIVQWDRRRMGLFVNGYRRGSTRLVTFVMLGAILICYAGSAWAAIDRHDSWVAAGFALLAMIAAFLGSIMWQRRFRREMGV